MIQAVTSDRPDGEPQHIRVALDKVLASYGLVAAADSLRLTTMNSEEFEVPASCHLDLMNSKREVISDALTSRQLLTIST